MSIVLRIVVAAVGIFLIYSVIGEMKKKKLSAAQSLLWLFAGIVLIILGIFPGIVHWLADIFGVSWPPALLVFFAFVILGFISLNHAKEISVLRAQVTELTEQVSVMKYQLQEKQVINKGSRDN